MPQVCLDFSQYVTSAIGSEDFFAITTSSDESSVVETTEVGGVKLDVLDWNSMNGLDGHNLDNGLSNWCFNNWCLSRRAGWCLSGGWGGARGGCLGGARGSGDFVLNSGVTNNTVALVVSDVSHDVFNSVSTGEPKRYRVN